MADESLDRIYIRDLMVRCIVGIYPDERTERQDVILNIMLEADLSRACASDDIGHTVNYKDLKKAILRRIEDSEFFLIERMAEEIATIALAVEGVRRVRVTVDKPGALRFARSVAVEIIRSNPAP
jgi:D-erythro-7,8-dihydroneopterin triphosphate epimerase